MYCLLDEWSCFGGKTLAAQLQPPLGSSRWPVRALGVFVHVPHWTKLLGLRRLVGRRTIENSGYATNYNTVYFRYNHVSLSNYSDVPACGLKGNQLGGCGNISCSDLGREFIYTLRT